MFEIGKLYKFTNIWSTGIYSSQENQSIGKLRQDEIFVLLEQNCFSTYMHYKILTTKGEIGWISPATIYIQPVEEQK